MPFVLREDRGRLAVLTLNRPDKLNALSPALMRELGNHIDDIAAHADDVGCVILRGAGRSFCAGVDLSTQAEGHDAADPRFRERIVHALEQLPQPVIAAVHGHCFTGAIELCLAADIIVASQTTTFRDTHAKWGMFPSWGGSVRLPRRIGMAAAKLVLFAGQPFGPDDALRMGLVQAVYPDAEFEARTDALAQAILENAGGAVRLAKRVMNECADLDAGEALDRAWSHRITDRAAINERIQANWPAARKD